jgi:hypothetical protein
MIASASSDKYIIIFTILSTQGNGLNIFKKSNLTGHKNNVIY